MTGKLHGPGILRLPCTFLFARNKVTAMERKTKSMKIVVEKDEKHTENACNTPELISFIISTCFPSSLD
jgi:hypothetical protein